jgi:outer membrane autotransporter protein
MTLKGSKGVFGMVNGANYGFGSPDATYNQGKIAINGALNLSVYSDTRAGGVIAGSWFGNTGAGSTTGNIKFGRIGSANVIDISGGQRDSMYGSDDDKMVGILGYSTMSSEKAVIKALGSTRISVDTRKSSKCTDVNRGTFGVYAASNSEISFEDATGTLSIDMTSSSDNRRRLDAISSGLYDFVSGGNSSITVTQKNTDISFGTAVMAIGISSYANSKIDLDTDLTIKGTDVNSMTGLLASHFYAEPAQPGPYFYVGGKIALKGGYTFSLPEGAVPSESRWKAVSVNAFKENEGKKAHVTVDGTGSISQINGGIYAIHGGLADITLDGANSFIQGHIDQRDSLMDGSQALDSSTCGKINLTLKNGAVWINTDYLSADTSKFGDGFSTADTVTMAGGTIDMSSAKVEGWQRSAYQKIILNSLKADSVGTRHGHMVFDMNLAEEVNTSATEDHFKANADQLIVKGSAKGNYSAAINFVNSSVPIDPSKKYSENWLIHQGLGSDMTVTNLAGGNTFYGSGMLTVWSLVFVPAGMQGQLDDDAIRGQLTNVGSGEGYWHLVRTDEPVPPVTPPVTPPLPPEVNDNMTIGTSAGQALAYLADLEDLRTRLGEVRYGSQDGAWVKAFSKKDTVKTSFKQDAYGINLGADVLVNCSEESAWLLGGAFRYGKAEQDGLGNDSVTGQLEEYSFKAYAAWMKDNGAYADFVAQTGRYEQELNGADNTGLGTSRANFSTYGYGLSAEVGHMLTIDDPVDDRRWYNHWFIEPQLQLAYFHVQGQDYKTSTGLAVSQGNADFLTGRAGLVLGKKFNYGTIDDLDRRYFQIALLGGVKHEFLGGDQTISYTGVDGAKASVRAGDIDGTRFYYGVNCDWQVTDNFRLYAQASREEGDRYTKDYDISIGGKLLF